MFVLKCWWIVLSYLDVADEGQHVLQELNVLQVLF